MSSGRARGNFWRGRGQRFRGQTRGRSQRGRGRLNNYDLDENVCNGVVASKQHKAALEELLERYKEMRNDGKF